MSCYTYLNSSFVGPYYEWFCDLGYPQCDLKIFEDGEWAILEMMNAPLCPSHTSWRWIARGFRNIEPQKSRVARILDEINPQKAKIWEDEERKSAQVESEHNARETRAEEIAQEWTSSIIRNPALTERIARNGMEEILPQNIAKHIPETKLKGA